MMSWLSLVQHLLYFSQKACGIHSKKYHSETVDKQFVQKKNSGGMFPCPSMPIIIWGHLYFPTLIDSRLKHPETKLFSNSAGKKCLYPAVSIYMWFEFGICALRGLILITPFVTIYSSSCNALRNSYVTKKKNLFHSLHCLL